MEAVIADKGYDACAIVARIQPMGATVVILSRKHWLVQRNYDNPFQQYRYTPGDYAVAPLAFGPTRCTTVSRL